MKSLFLQFRQEPDLRAQEYEDVLRFSGLKADQLVAKYVAQAVPDETWLFDIDSIVVGAGGNESVTQGSAQWIGPWLTFVQSAWQKKVPMIGFNVGAHLLTLAFGGLVSRDEHGKIIGSFSVHKTPEAEGDRLLSDLPSCFVVQEGHMDHMVEVPAQARQLLSSPSGTCECWGIPEDGVYAFEFQLDIDEARLVDRLIAYHATYATEPGELEHYLLSVKPSPEASTILRHFFERIVDSETTTA